ncbi:Exosc10, partial [Symbiodinium microadriaticum]
MESSLYELVVDMIDILLEGADLKLDSATGVRASLNAVVKEALALDRDRIFRETTADIPKPQVKYENSRTRPFRPNISEKPNAISPLDLCELPVEDDEGHTTERPATFYPHPYEEELRAFGKNLYTKQPPYVVDSGYVRPVMPQGAALRPFAYIDTVEDLATAAEEMEGFSELAVDLEHHAYRSFQGITCLMQISTREKDYVLDAIILRQNLQAALLPLFTDPEIVKVFHGCDSDILWLQKDFGLYVVNCFDTYHAAKALRYPALSLAHLLKYHCGITLNKKHQLADWRIRPLPEDMLCYARSDTHYLLYIYDCLRRDIYTAQGVSALLAVWMASMHTCLKRYEKEPFYPLGYTRLFTDSRGWSGAPAAVDVSPEQHIALASLWSWRDSMARREDESPLFIMSNAELLRIGRAIPLTEESLLECSPLSAFVRAHMNDLMETLLEPLRGAGSKLTETIPSQSSRLGHTSAADDTNCSGGSGTSSTPVHTPGRVGLGAWSVQDATRARHGQVKRLEGCV